EHHAALLPWSRRDVTVLDAPDSPRQAVETLERALADRDPHGPALVCVTGASNVTGELWPVRELAAAAHAHGARIVLDAAQLAPHHPVSVRDLDVDWVAFSGHKLYAPFGSGVLAGRADWLRTAEPYLAGGGASRRVGRRADGGVDVEWHTDAARHEAGSPNVIGVHALASACRALTEAGFDTLVAREQRLIRRVREELADVPEVRWLSLFGDDAPRVGVLSFVVEGWSSSHFAAALSAEYGIGVRDGLFCAHPLVRKLLGGAAGHRGECGAPDAAAGERALNAVRVSLGAGTPDEHVERFVRAVRELVRDGARWTYRTGDGRCVRHTYAARTVRRDRPGAASPRSGRAGASAVQPDGERGLQVVLGVRAERDVRVRALDAGNLADPAGDDLGQVLVLPDPDHRDQVVGAGDGEDLADAVQRGDPLRDLGDPVHAGLDEDDRGDHGW